MKRDTILKIIAYSFVVLFLYTAFSKLMVYEQSLNDLERSPFINQFALPLSILLPLIEISISIMLLIPKYRFVGFIGSAVLMTLFTIYVSVMVFTLKSLPCSCGGLIRELTWKQHFFFNIFFTLIAYLGIWLDRNRTHQTSKYKLSI
jgi:putative oxidoreductase